MDFFFNADFAMKVKFRSKTDSLIVQFELEIGSSKFGSSILIYCIFFEKEHIKLRWLWVHSISALALTDFFLRTFCNEREIKMKYIGSSILNYCIFFKIYFFEIAKWLIDFELLHLWKKKVWFLKLLNGTFILNYHFTS